jgi:hypothetical protein
MSYSIHLDDELGIFRVLLAVLVLGIVLKGLATLAQGLDPEASYTTSCCDYITGQQN